MTITPCLISDLPAVLELQRLCYQENAARIGDWDIPPLTQDLASLEAELAAGPVLKGIVDGRIIGSVRARASGDAWLIGKLIVHPGQRGRGYGRRLLEAAEDSGRVAGATRFELFTGSLDSRNLAIYARAGYRPFKTERVHERLSLVFLDKPARFPG
jgi:GNAT superfamily N-acetyltransferase